MGQIESGSWKSAAIALAAGIFTALVSALVISIVHDGRDAQAHPNALEAGDTGTSAEVPHSTGPALPARTERNAVVLASDTPRRRSLEDCERYRYGAHTDGGRVVKNGLIGGALGAGLGAAGGAIGGKAGKGAGIGALAGAVTGSGYTLYDEHEKKEAARRAYGACLARNGS